MCDGPVATAYSILQGMGWHWQAPRLFTRERDDLTLDCWMDLKTGGSMRSGMDCVLPNGEKQVTDAAT